MTPEEEYRELLQEIADLASAIANKPIIFSDVATTFYPGMIFINEETANGHPNKWTFGDIDEDGSGQVSGLLDSKQQCIEGLAQIVVNRFSNGELEKRPNQFLRLNGLIMNTAIDPFDNPFIN